MRYLLASVSPEGNLLKDSKWESVVFGMLFTFFLVKVNLYFEDEGPFTRFVFEKCRMASPTFISGEISGRETDVSSKSRM